MVKRVLLVAIIAGILALFDYVWFIMFKSEMSFTILLAEVGGVFIYTFVRYGNEHYQNPCDHEWTEMVFSEGSYDEDRWKQCKKCGEIR